MTLVRGIDVSAMQGAPRQTDVRALVTSGVAVAGIRCAVGNEKARDATLQAWLSAFETARIVAFPYFFVYPLPHIDPREQARHHLALADGFGTNLGEMPPAVDAEWPPRETRRKDGSVENTWAKWGCSAAQIRDWLAAYLDEMTTSIGTRPLFYSYRYWLSCVEAAKLPELGEYPLWLADYFATGRVPTDEECAKLVVPAPWTEITMVQHDGNGGLKLASGVDADFNVVLGGIEVVQRMAGLERSAGSGEASAPAPAVVHAAADALLLEDAIADYRASRIDTG